MKNIASKEDFQKLKTEKSAVLFYFSQANCSVCKALLPKIESIIEKKFPKIEVLYINTIEQPELCGQERIFSIPTILVYFEGSEFYRKSRHFGTDEFIAQIERPYNLLFHTEV